MLTQQAVLSRGDRAYWCIRFFEKVEYPLAANQAEPDNQVEAVPGPDPGQKKC